MAKTVRAILGDIYDAWRAQNIDWMAAYLPDDFCHVIHIPADLNPHGGTRNGKKDALERLRLIEFIHAALNRYRKSLLCGFQLMTAGNVSHNLLYRETAAASGSSCRHADLALLEDDYISVIRGIRIDLGAPCAQ